MSTLVVVNPAAGGGRAGRLVPALLDGLPPGPSVGAEGKPVFLQVGEPRNAPPDFVAEAIAEAASGWSRRIRSPPT